jgi:hypothetical protein
MKYFAGFARLADEENKGEPFQKLVFLIRNWLHPDYDFGHYDDNTSINGKISRLIIQERYCQHFKMLLFDAISRLAFTSKQIVKKNCSFHC